MKEPAFAKKCVDETIQCFGELDMPANNHAVQFIQRSILDISPRYVFLASEDPSYMAGQVLHPNGAVVGP